MAVSGLGGSSRPSFAAAFAAPQSLFILLAMFSWLDPDPYDAYRPLFAAGKLISAVCLGVWMLVAIPSLVGTASLNEVRFFIALSAVAAVAVYDLLSGLLVALSLLYNRSPVEAAEDLPTLVVDEVADEVGGS